VSTHALEWWLVRGLAAHARGLDWPHSLEVGANLGDLARRLGIRRAVADDNLARAFPDRSVADRRAILLEHYRELGRIVMEYPRIPELVQARGDDVVAVTGLEHVLAARERGRGAIVMAGHFGNFELSGAWLGQHVPLDFVTRPLSNPHVDRWVADLRRRAGVGMLRADRDVREIYAALRANRCVAMLADQDARRQGVFVPFFGRPASTPTGPARIALATGAAMIMGTIARRADGGHLLQIEPPFEPPSGKSDEAVAELTRQHTARLEARVRQHPWNWFWLHKRWKTQPPA